MPQHRPTFTPVELLDAAGEAVSRSQDPDRIAVESIKLDKMGCTITVYTYNSPLDLAGQNRIVAVLWDAGCDRTPLFHAVS